MKEHTPKNIAASVKQRLMNISREREEAHGLTLNHFAVERFLYRISISSYRDRFVLKGARLFAVWTGRVYRPTRDIDFLGYEESDPERLTAILREICGVLLTLMTAFHLMRQVSRFRRFARSRSTAASACI